MDGALLVDDPEDDEGPVRGTVVDAAKAEQAREVLAGIISRMGLDAGVSVREVAEQVVLDVSGRDAGRAIGKKGQTLDALQFLVNKVVNRFPENRCYVVVDSGDYRERHEQSLVSMARREAKRAVQQGRTITLSPMPARDRRLVHPLAREVPGRDHEEQRRGHGAPHPDHPLARLDRRQQAPPRPAALTHESARVEADPPRRAAEGERVLARL
ncbi:MAG: KH domain-containing protein [Sandaracinaceae bacterium]|nr:KH domain-containing protein [Sandaracinaceae bacterium]